MYSTMRITAATVAIVAGTTFASAPSAKDKPDQHTTQTDRYAPGRSASDRTGTRTPADARRQSLVFLRAHDLLGTSIKNANRAEVGEVDDFIINRGTGEIEYVILKDGGFLGFGGKQVAIPYSQFAYDPAAKRYRLNVTPEQIDNAAEFDASEWVTLDHKTWRDQLAKVYEDTFSDNDGDGRLDNRDPYVDGFQDAESVNLSGTVTSVDRDSFEGGDQQLVVGVRTDDGRTESVILGPSWYVMSQQHAPMRGDEIKLDARRVYYDGQSRLIATGADIGGNQLHYRNDDGTPRWYAADRGQKTDADQASGTDQAGRLAPLMLLSDLTGMPARAHGEESGEIQDAIIEVRSGHVAILALDPNENFLGIADELLCVPWGVVGVAGDTVQIDADKNMLTAGQPVPDDLSTFSSPASLRPVYTAYSIDVPRFQADRHDRQASRDRGMGAKRGDAGADAWSGDSALSKAVRDGRSLQVNGIVQSTRMIDDFGEAGRAMAVVIKTDAGTESVVFGPQWFVDRQQDAVQRGDHVSIEGKVITLNSREYNVAAKVTNESDGTELVLWNNNRPAWDAG